MRGDDVGGGVIVQHVKQNYGSDGVDVDPVKTTAITAGSSANVTTSSAEVVASNTARREVILTNGSDTDIWLSFGGTAVAGSGILLKAGGGFASIDSYNGSIRAIHAGTGTKTIGVVIV